MFGASAAQIPSTSGIRWSYAAPARYGTSGITGIPGIHVFPWIHGLHRIHDFPGFPGFPGFPEIYSAISFRPRSPHAAPVRPAAAGAPLCLPGASSNLHRLRPAWSRLVFSTAHLTSGLALAFALGLEGWPFVALVFASVFTDWDFAFQLLSGRNHRTFVTHSPPVYVAALLPLGFWNPLAWYVLAGSMLHFALDLWEYGLRLNPFRNRVFGARLLPGVENLAFREYLRVYFGDRRFLGAEIVFAVAAAGLAFVRLG